MKGRRTSLSAYAHVFTHKIFSPSMAKKAPESKASKEAKIAKSSSKEKKKWTTGKTKDEVSRQACVDPELLGKIVKDVPNMKMITRSTLVEKYNINLYSSIRVLRWLCENEIVGCVSAGRRLKVYCGSKFVKKEVVEDVTKKEEELEAWGN
ncbi:40S ribosomal protein S25 [Trachipleistophora hominis]|uniref:40S ribosomal protein S25 n=1 Tax=Trachipleistophora hominis TaxID=72359 RepID=L7JTS4_TRAHO|nr:40S ribosomal protein S25 [Trachipleistophora hominis]